MKNNGSINLSGNSNDASGYYDLGTHKITFTVEDGCNNFTTCSFKFTIVDAKKPTPICINGLSVDLMPNSGEVTIWASDFQSGSSYDNCTDYDDLEFSFSEDVDDIYLTFDCDDLGTQVVEMWVTDEAGNQDFCTTYIIVQDNNDVCDPLTTASVAGSIETEMGEEVQDVTVQVEGSNAIPVITGSNGSFAFPSLPMGGGYTIAPEKNMNPLNGVTTFDLVLISKHVLGTGLLNSPYKMIAADINASGSITTFDVVQGRRLILGIATEFQNNTSWRFVDANHVFSNPANPFADNFPEVVSIDHLSSDEAADFVAVKIGDVNGTSVANSLLGSETRSADGTLVFDLDEKTVKNGEQIEVAFKAKDFNQVNGFQFTFTFDNTMLDFVDMVPGFEKISTENFGLTMLDEGIITASWSDARELTIEDESPLFTLVFNGLANGQLSNAIALNSSVTKSEAYKSGIDLMDVQLSFSGVLTAKNEFQLLQNRPNPVSDATIIPFNMVEAGKATLKLIDVSGKVAKVIVGEYSKGYNEINLTREDLPAEGVIFYQMETDAHTAVKKMILLKK